MDLLLLVAAQTLVITTMARAIHWLYGVARLLCLNAAVFASMGAYMVGLGATQSLPILVLYPFVALIAAATGYLFGRLVARLRGDYFAIATYLSQVAFVSLLFAMSSVTRGALGISGIPNLPLVFGSEFAGALIFAGVYAVAGVAFLRALTQSRSGRELRIAAEDSVFAASIGIDTSHVAAVGISAVGALCAVGGALLGQLLSYVDPTVFGSSESLLYLSIAFVGVLIGKWGLLIGALLYVVLPVGLRFWGVSPEIGGALRQMVLAGLLVICVVALWRGAGTRNAPSVP